jgi:hypothetical protein
MEGIIAHNPVEGKKSWENTGLMIVPRDEKSVLNFQSIRVQLLNLLEEYKAIAATKGGLGLKKENGFRELVQKDVGRYDLNLDHLVPGKSSGRELSESEHAVLQIYMYVESRIRPYLEEIFPQGFIFNQFGAVISSPGTTAQGWHVDSSHLFVADTPEKEEIYKHIPGYFVTVFCPLFDFSQEIGVSEIALSTHRLTSILGNKTVEDQYPPQEVCDKFLSAPGVRVIKNQSRIGDIGIMDGRTLHRGGHNVSQELRPLMYLSFCLPWYHEFPASQSDGRSLFA